MIVRNNARFEVAGQFWRLLGKEKTPRLQRPWINQDPEEQRDWLNDDLKTLRAEFTEVDGFDAAQVQLDYLDLRVQHAVPEMCVEAAQKCLPIAQRYADFVNAVAYAEVKTEIDELILNDRIRSVLIDAEILTVKRLCDYTYGSLMNMGLSVGEVEIIERRLSERGLRLSAE